MTGLGVFDEPMNDDTPKHDTPNDDTPTSGDRLQSSHTSEADTSTDGTTTAIDHLDIDYTDGSPLAVDDPRGAMARSVQAARAVIACVDAENAGNATPCADWTALEVARHIVAVFDRAAAGPTDQVIDEMAILADVPIDGLTDAALASARTVHANWSDDAAMTRPIDVPWGTLPGAAVIGVYAAETIVHTWDLAAAIGVGLNWPESDVAVHYEMSMVGIPESPRDELMPFDPVVRPGDDAPMIEHLVGWQGRDVDRWRVR